jgi:hypothetical protein
MSTTRRAVLLATIAAVVLSAGCAESAPSRLVAPALVTPSDELLSLGSVEEGGNWEDYRRDDALGVGASSSTSRERYWVEIRSVDRRSTIEGRTHESSRTRTTVVRQRSASSE